jgi:hypothetical protein
MAKATAAAFPESIRPLRCFVLVHHKAVNIWSAPYGLLANEPSSLTKKHPLKSHITLRMPSPFTETVGSLELAAYASFSIL